MDDLFSAVIGLMLIAIAIYVAIVVTVAAVSVVLFTGALIVAPALALTFLILRVGSVDVRQAHYRFKQLNLAFYAVLLIPGAFFTYHTYETGEVHPFLVGCNVAIWAATIGYGLWLGFERLQKWRHHRALPNPARHLKSDGSVDVLGLAGDNPTTALYEVPPDWQSDNYARRAQQGKQAITGKAAPRASEPPTYPNKQVRDTRAAEEAMREWSDLFEDAADRAEDQSYRQTITSR